MAPRSGKDRPSDRTLVLLVRHGRTPSTGAILPGRAPGLDLAPEGVAQAEAAAARMVEVPNLAAVYTSPLERARQTAAPIAKTSGLKVKVERGLVECDFGEWTGAELKKLSKLPEWTTVQRWPSGFRFPGGESFAEMHSRVNTAVGRLAANHVGSAIVLVSHADPIKAVVASALGTHLDLFQRIVISPCSITAISYGPSGPVVLGINTLSGVREMVPS